MKIKSLSYSKKINKRYLTRTVGVISLSRFLRVLSHLPGPVTSLAPWRAPLNVIKLLHLDYFQPSIKLCIATAAPLPFTNFIYLDYFLPFSNFVPRPRLHSLKFVPRRQKHAPYLSCHRDYFSAKATGQMAGWLRQVTLTPSTAGPLQVIVEHAPKEQTPRSHER